MKIYGKWKVQNGSVQFCRPIRLGEVLRAPQQVCDRVADTWERAGKPEDGRFVVIYDEQGGDILGYIDALACKYGMNFVMQQ